MSTRDLAHVALFAAVTAALGLLPAVALPFVPVPVTAQTLGPMLAGAVLGARRAALSQLTFLALVAAGLPLLSGGRGGLAPLLGPSAGYLLGFVAGAWVVGLLSERLAPRLDLPRLLLATVVGGIAVVHAIGIPVMAVLGDLTLAEAAVGSLAFLPGDLVKAAVASGVAVTVHRSYPVALAR